MKISRLMLTAILALGSIAAVPAGAQAPESPTQEANIDTYVNLLRQDIKSQKVAILSQLMNFSPEQASTFWPIYAQYSQELAKLGDVLRANQTGARRYDGRPFSPDRKPVAVHSRSAGGLEPSDRRVAGEDE